MAGLLVAMALMSLMLSVAMPTWRTLIQREKEEELIWRGQQYDRAIQLYRKKNAAPGAPSAEKLVEGRFLRKKYKDPITGSDFEFVGVSAPPSAPGVQQPGGVQQQRPGGVEQPGVAQQPGGAQRPGVQQPGRGYGELIGGVRSKSKARSLRVLNGRRHYHEWQFTYVPWKPGGQPTVPGGPQNRAPNQPAPGAPGSAPFGPSGSRGNSTPGTSGSGTGTSSPFSPR